MSRLLCLALVISTFGVNGLSQAGSAKTVSPTANQNNRPVAERQADLPDDYVIGVEDELSILVWREPELSTKVTVRPDGKISVQFLGDIKASGLVPKDLVQQIEVGLRKYVNDPQVSVTVIQIKSLVVYVTGSVGRAGVVTYGGPMTIMELLIKAGGLSEFAKTDKIQILRKERGKEVRHLFNYKRFVEGKDIDKNILIRPGDMVIVP